MISLAIDDSLQLRLGVLVDTLFGDLDIVFKCLDANMSAYSHKSFELGRQFDFNFIDSQIVAPADRVYMNLIQGCELLLGCFGDIKIWLLAFLENKEISDARLV